MASAQDSPRVGVQNEIFVGSEIESYLRVLQVTGKIPLYPWSIRGLSSYELRQLSPGDELLHPWAQQYDLTPDTSGVLGLGWVRPRVKLTYNATAPAGVNDGIVWAGRGLTTTIQGGLWGRFGPLSATIAPVAFWTENDPFPLALTGKDGVGIYADPRFPHSIDLPQRFGSESYSRVDLGETTIRLDAFGATVGVSTASQQWCPAREFPLVLGNNAGGFPHLFVGTASPLDLWLGTVHGRVVWGKLDRSEFFIIEEGDWRRYMSGLVAVLTPRGLPGLEVGISRFFHHAPNVDRETWLQAPLDVLLKKDTEPGTEGEQNQLAALFARWVLPQSGFELFAEYARDDHNWDFRDAVLEPDHISGFALGFSRVWSTSESRWARVRGEILNARISHLERVRLQFPFYVHLPLQQGHTVRGQLLAAPAAYGGAGSILGVDSYWPGGRWTLEWRREVPNESAGLSPSAQAVRHSLGAEALLFRSRFEITAGVRGLYTTAVSPGTGSFNTSAWVGLTASLR